NERHHRTTKLLGQFHDAQRFSITFRLGHSEIPVLALLGISAFLMSDETDWLVQHRAETADNCSVITEFSIAVDFKEVGTQMLDVIQKVRTLRMPCELYLLVRRKLIHIL